MTLSPPLADPVQTLVAAVRLGAPVSVGGVTVFPLFLGDDDPAEGIRLSPATLDQALGQGQLRVEEVSEAGSVPDLRLTNLGGQEVFLLDGEQVLGVKQNRTFNLSMLLPPEASVVVPVSCLEQGRWNRRDGSARAAEHAHFAQGRSSKMRSVSRSLASMRSYRSDQSRVWQDISMLMDEFNAFSPTAAEADVYDARRDRLGEVVEAVKPQPGQAGAVFLDRGRVIGADLFGDPALYAELAPKLARSYALFQRPERDDANSEASAAGAETNPEATARAFLSAAARAAKQPFPAPGLGETWRFEAEAVHGAALAHEGRCLHLAAFAE